MALTIARGYAFSSGETVTPTKINTATVPVITMATGTLVGRSTAGTGSIEEIALGAGIALAASTLTVGWLDTNSSHRMRLACGSDITADRTITITGGDADRTITLTGNATLNQDVSTAGSPSFQAISGTTGTFSGTVTTTGANSTININPTAGGYGTLGFQDGSTNKFQIYKSTANTLEIYNNAQAASILTVAANNTTATWTPRLVASGGMDGVIGATTPAAGSFTTLSATGGAWFGTAALATGATTGHVYMQTSAGAPTGVPAAKTGQVAFQFDTTNNKLYVYDGAWLSTPALT